MWFEALITSLDAPWKHHLENYIERRQRMGPIQATAPDLPL